MLLDVSTTDGIGTSVFIDDECDGPGGGDSDDFDYSDGSSCSDDEQHAGGQVADQPTTGGLYVTEADAHGTAATFRSNCERYH